MARYAKPALLAKVFTKHDHNSRTDRTGHTFAQVGQIAGTTADNLDETGMQQLINQLLIDFGKTRHITPPIASALIQEIRDEQPQITDNDLLGSDLQLVVSQTVIQQGFQVRK